MNQREHNFLTEMTERISKLTDTKADTDSLKSLPIKLQSDTNIINANTETKIQRRNKLYYRQKLLDKLVNDCITYRLTEREAHRYIEEEYGKPISSKTYFNIKSRIESQSEETGLIWLDEFTRIGFVQHHKKLMDNLERIYEDNLNRFFIESRKEPRNEELILKLNANIRENTTLLSNLSMGSPIIAAVKAKLQQSETRCDNQIMNNNLNRRREQEVQEGLTAKPWDNNHWSQCGKCQKWYRSELTEGSCNNCANLPKPII